MKLLPYILKSNFKVQIVISLCASAVVVLFNLNLCFYLSLIFNFFCFIQTAEKFSKYSKNTDTSTCKIKPADKSLHFPIYLFFSFCFIVNIPCKWEVPRRLINYSQL